ncbi:PilW family protein [Algibacillus agarilyticus]|uniref:PilW family protein n=1 Tax=Algibacillus agarilyticus TaxID=2234133 RepID=UPI000DCFACE6|nr:PilW family protein [Algibacillus agarilyticus]
MRYFRGFTLTELLVSLVISSLVFIGIINVLIVSDETINETTQRAELQENAQLALNFLSQDIQMIGYWGPYTGHDLNLQATAGGKPVRLLSALNGNHKVAMKAVKNDCIRLPHLVNPHGTFVNSASENGFITVWGAEKKRGDKLLNNCIKKAKPQSDVIQIKRMIAHHWSASFAVQKQLMPSRFYMLAKSNEAIIFAGNDTIPLFYDDTQINGRIGEYQHYVYYVENEHLPYAENRDVVIPVLKRKYLYKAEKSSRAKGMLKAQPLVEGIEHIGFLYGIDSDADGNINSFYKAENLTWNDWQNANSRIKAIKIFVLARTILAEPRIGDSVHLSYDLGSKVIRFKAGSFLANAYRRLLLTKTVNIINHQG